MKRLLFLIGMLSVLVARPLGVVDPRNCLRFGAQFFENAR